MSRPVPLGEPESQGLEFKGVGALRDLSTVARAVVGMLNAGGGEVWIGIDERDGRAVRVEGIPDAEREARRLRDHLVDSIAPSPLEAEVAVSLVPHDSGKTVLLVQARPGRKRGTYAYVRAGGWHFPVRVGDRLRPMSREEIFERKTSDETADRVLRRLRKEKAALQAGKAAVYWVRVQPLEPARVPKGADWLEEWLTDPRRTGNRPLGWNFTHPSPESERRVDRLVHGGGSSRHTEVFWDGGLSFRTPLENLHWRGPERVIWPFILLELPVSLFRLARALYQEIDLSPEADVAGDLAIFGLRGWILRPGSRPDLPSRFEEESRFEAGDDLVLDDPLSFRCREILDQPDRCAMRLVTKVYEAFGHGNEAIPREFDWASGRLVIPE